MKYLNIFHANLNYAYITPDMYEYIIRATYEMVIDTMRENFPDTKYVFEASGYTVDEIAKKTPDVLEKLNDAIQRGECEFMGSPYAHPMLPNFPKEDGIWSIKFSNEAYQKHLGIQPKSFWNPECGWRKYVPEQVMECGYTNLLGDFEAYSRSLNAQGKPNRPEIYEAEHSDEVEFYSFGFKYKMAGNEMAIHFPFDKIEGLPEGKLRSFLRTDRIAQFAVRYFMGMEGYSFEKYLELIKKYSQQKEGEPQGALIVFADDVEYVGTNSWFKMKYLNQPDNIFEPTPDSKDKLIQLVETVKTIGEFCTYDDACNLSPLPDVLSFDDDSAWHGAKASTWASTPFAQMLRPWQDLVRAKLKKNESQLSPFEVKRAWFYLTNSYNSDGQWPPTLPEAPHFVHPFNYGYCLENLLSAEMVVGGVDRSSLKTTAKDVIDQVLSIQQNLILEKAESLRQNGTKDVKQNAEKAVALIAWSSNSCLDVLENTNVLSPAEYKIRTDALIEARRLVGGVQLEKVIPKEKDSYLLDV